MRTRNSQFWSVKILLILLLPVASLSDEARFDGDRFQLTVPNGFFFQQGMAIEGEGVATYIFFRTVESKLPSIIQLSIFPPSPDFNLESTEEVRRACIVGLKQHFSSLKKGRTEFSHSDPTDIEIDGVRGVKATWTAIYESEGLVPNLPEKGVFYVVADAKGFLTIRVGGDESNFTSITLVAVQAIESMGIQKPLAAIH